MEGAKERNVVLGFAFRAYNCKVYVVLILPSCTKDRYKRITGEYTSVEINFVVEFIIHFYEKQGGIALRYTAVSTRAFRSVSSTLTFCSFRFSETRWADDRPVPDRAIEPSAVKCVACWERLSMSRRSQIKSYEWLVECFSDPFVPAKLHFFSFVAGIFEPYLTRFQTDAPIVPFMFDGLSAIFKKLVGLIFKKCH